MTSPNPTWKPRSPITPPHHSWTTFDPSSTTIGEFYKVMVNSICPRPIAFVSTVNAAGQCNLAPFSFFNAICSNPPTVMVSVARKPDGSKKDTLLNIEETKQFVVNTASSWFVEAMVHAAGGYPYGVDEFEQAGFTKLASTKIKPPRVKEAAVHFECELDRLVEIGNGDAGSATVVFGRIIFAHVMTDAIQDGRINSEKLAPVARLGGINYAELGKIYQLAIPEVTVGQK